MGTLAVAGWYADPTDADLMRYWDGATWTEHTALPLTSEPQASEPHPAQLQSGQQLSALGQPVPHDAPIEPYPTYWPVEGAEPANPKARTAITFALLSVLINPLFVLSVAAIVLGAQGNALADGLARHGQKPVGRSRARWAIGIGVVVSIINILVIGRYLTLLS